MVIKFAEGTECVNQLKVERSLDYPGGPNVFTRVLKREERESERESNSNSRGSDGDTAMKGPQRSEVVGGKPTAKECGEPLEKVRKQILH